MRVKLMMAVLALWVVMTGLLLPSTAAAAESSTQVAVTCPGVSGPVTAQFSISTSASDQVGQGTTSPAQFDVAIGEFFSIPAPYSGTITMEFGFSASNASPTSFTLETPETHFDEGDFIQAVSLVQLLTATGSPGTAISVQFLSFSYTIRPDAGDAFTNGPCQADTATVVATIPIVSTTPTSKADCKKGGWEHVSDAVGSPFSTQGQCVRTTVGAAKT